MNDPTALSIIREIREKQDYSLCPILADALQDADYSHEYTLKILREESNPIPFYRILCSLLGGEYLKSLQWIDTFVVELGNSYGYGIEEEGEPPTQPMNYAILMSVAQENIDSGDTLTQEGGMHWQDHFHDNQKEFWKHWEVVTGKEDKPRDTWGIFGCSC